MTLIQMYELLRAELSEIKRLVAGQTSEIMDVEMLHVMTGISRSAIYQKTCSRRGQPPELPHFKRGKRVYFRRSEILEWLMEHRVKNREEIEREADEYFEDRSSQVVRGCTVRGRSTKRYSRNGRNEPEHRGSGHMAADGELIKRDSRRVSGNSK